MPNAKKDLPYYLALRYAYELTPCPEGGYFARHPDLDGCATQAETVQEAMANLEEARELWLESQIANNANIPEPPNEEPSGRLMLRVPLCLHSVLDQCARELDLSLNRLLNEVLFNHANRLPLEHGLKSPSLHGNRPHGHQENRSLEYYLGLRYPYYLTPSEEGGFVAEHPDLPGCIAQGDSAEESVAELDSAREVWLVSRHEEGLPIPEPLALDQTGIINLRMPPALHYHLARHATRNGVSLNQWLVMALSEFTGGNTARKQTGSNSREIGRERERGDTGSEPGIASQRRVSHKLETNNRINFPIGIRLQKPSSEIGQTNTRLDFLNGLRALQRREFVKAFEGFACAYRDGLNFSTTAVALYREMPDPVPTRELHGLLFEMCQVVPGNESDRREIYLLLVTWLEGIKEKVGRQERWLAIGREERALAYAS